MLQTVYFISLLSWFVCNNWLSRCLILVLSFSASFLLLLILVVLGNQFILLNIEYCWLKLGVSYPINPDSLWLLSFILFKFGYSWTLDLALFWHYFIMGFQGFSAILRIDYCFYGGMLYGNYEWINGRWRCRSWRRRFGGLWNGCWLWLGSGFGTCCLVIELDLRRVGKWWLYGKGNVYRKLT